MVALATLSFATALPAQQRPLADVSVAQFRSLAWLEGTWRGEGGGNRPFYERYRFVDDSTLRSWELADSLGTVRDSGMIALRGGHVTTGNYGVTRIEVGAVRFDPVRNASNDFTWTRDDGDGWTAVLHWPATASRPERSVTYVMRRIGARPAGTSSAVERARADSARYPWTAADAQFMTRMIGHHAQAITMARMAPSHGAGDEVGRLAARIINAQEDEIALMQRWLRNRAQPWNSAG
jgi:hypothetical protein